MHNIIRVNAQKRRLLPRACSGAGIGGMGMSEPDAGTDVLGMRAVARRRPDGGFALTGTKMWAHARARAQ